MKAFSANQYVTLSHLDDQFPTTVLVPNGQDIIVDEGNTAYGYVATDGGLLQQNERSLNLYAGMYFCVAGKANIKNMQGLVCVREDFIGLFTYGGPIETRGRLKYIDGCSDTLLLSPTLMGEPCLNYLYVPPHIDQTAHTHPSLRVGYVLEGKGHCLHSKGRFDLTPNNIFVLTPDEIHSFHTEDNFLRIVVYHPDSDFGPTHEIHPMINKTYVDGESLRGMNRYRTTEIR